MNKRLYRSTSDRMLGGVCGGLGDYLGIDPTFIRIFFFIMIFGGSVGFWLYILLWILVPEDGSADAGEFSDRFRNLGDDVSTAVSRPHPKAGLIIGGSLILLGIFWLIEQLNISWLWWWDFDVLWPVMLIIGGGVLLFRWYGERSA